MTQVVTFYSYKGGVGRTMALVNVAHVLARDGWRVLMVDFDLEAPGMTHFLADSVRSRPETVRYDALDLLLHAKRSLADADADGRKPEIPSSLTEYIVGVKLPDEWLEQGERAIPYRNGRLDLLPATLEAIQADELPEAEPTYDYLRRMDELDLTGIFSHDGPRHRFGDHVRQYLIGARFRTPGDVLFTMREEVVAAYDIVLIDSRTGLNEISGLCIGPLCDCLVICLGLNQQNIYGTRYFMDKAGLLDREKAKPYLVVAGPVPVWHSRQSGAQIDLLKRELQANNIVAVPYHPVAAIKETVFVIDEPEEPIAKAYEELAPKVAGLIKEEFRPEAERGILSLFTEGTDKGFDNLSEAPRIIANYAHAFRLSKRKHHLRPVGLLASFPSACTIASLPSENAGRLGSEDIEPMSLAAGVAAYRLKSDRPFKRAWQLIPLFRDGDTHAASDWTIRLAFFQLRVLGSVPNEETYRGILRDALNRSEEIEKLDYMHPEAVAFVLDGLFTSHQLKRNDIRLNTADMAVEGITKRIAVLLKRSHFRDYYVFHRQHRHLYKYIEVLEHPEKLYRLFYLQFTETPTDENRDAFSRMLGAIKFPLPLEKFRTQNSLMREIFSPGMMSEMMERDRPRPPLPLGFWLEPFIASATAFVKGPSAVDEVLAWIMLSRLSYGYAWRVLVDWRYLESVKDHPSFVQFLREEDAMVEEIESAFDRGEYTL
jgi:MinD-like ATPase involved in chromosome partitioning or flagellar assembly